VQVKVPPAAISSRREMRRIFRHSSSRKRRTQNTGTGTGSHTRAVSCMLAGRLRGRGRYH
jgi:hypothetical protein